MRHSGFTNTNSIVRQAKNELIELAKEKVSVLPKLKLKSGAYQSAYDTTTAGGLVGKSKNRMAGGGLL